jgi:hypothetical protein
MIGLLQAFSLSKHSNEGVEMNYYWFDILHNYDLILCYLNLKSFIPEAGVSMFYFLFSTTN